MTWGRVIEMRKLFNQPFAETDCRLLRRGAAFLTEILRNPAAGMLRRVTFSTRRKSPKTRTGRGCSDLPLSL